MTSAGRARAEATLLLQESARIDDLANINFSADVRVFAVMTALNAAGYDYEDPGKTMSAQRQAVRRRVAGADPLLLTRLQAFYASHRHQGEESLEHAAYISLALLLSGPPEFQLAVGRKDLPEDVLRVLGFEELVREFYQTARLDELWQEYRPGYTATLATYRPVIMAVIRQVLGYFRIPARVVLDRQIVLMPDLVGPRNIVNARNLERVYYIVLGPVDQPAEHHIQLQHEYLHFLIDPLMTKFGEPLLRYEHLLNLAQNQPRIKSEYQNRYMAMVTESLIESLLLRLNPPENAEREMVALFRRGLIFSPYFDRGLRSYEASDLMTFPSYIELLFQGVTDTKIREDDDAIIALEKKIAAEDAAKMAALRSAEAEAARQQRIRSLLSEAGTLLSQKLYASAREKLNLLLEEDPGHGDALFYQAQIAFQEKEYGRAFDLYGRVVASPRVTLWVRAWALLRMGNYLAYQDRFGEARDRFEQVLAMEGDLKGAREEAQRSIQELPPKEK